MKETLSLLVISLVVLIVSATSFKSVSSSTIKPSKTLSVKTEQSSTAKEKDTKKTGEQVSSEELKSEEPVSEEIAAEQVAEQAAEEPAPAPAPAVQPTPQPAPAPQVDYSYANTYVSSSAADRLNAAPLYPQYTSCGELNNIISSIINGIISPDMSNYQKAKACYSYIINTCSDGYISGSYSYKTGGWNINAQALALFTEHRGMCDCYSAGFTVLARAVGFNCSQVEGDIPYYTDHDWAEINVGGIRYIFDPDVEEDMTHSGTENRFCKTYSELPEYYYKRTIG